MNMLLAEVVHHAPGHDPFNWGVFVFWTGFMIYIIRQPRPTEGLLGYIETAGLGFLTLMWLGFLAMAIKC